MYGYLYLRIFFKYISMVKWFNKLCILKGVYMLKLKVRIVDLYMFMFEEIG